MQISSNKKTIKANSQWLMANGKINDEENRRNKEIFYHHQP